MLQTAPDAKDFATSEQWASLSRDAYAAGQFERALAPTLELTKAYTIFPEILQVPLIVHLPARQRGELNADPRAVAFTSDVTPTIYRLLGHEPARPASFFGQPLYHRRSTAPGARPQVEVVASSYGSVYGALLDDARRLYIIDGVSFREHEYELDGTGAGHALEVRAADRAAAQAAIRATVGDIARFFKYPQGTDR